MFISKLAMEQYLQHAINSLHLTEVTTTVICEFLSSNVIDKSLYSKVFHSFFCIHVLCNVANNEFVLLGFKVQTRLSQ